MRDTEIDPRGRQIRIGRHGAYQQLTRLLVVPLEESETSQRGQGRGGAVIDGESRGEHPVRLLPIAELDGGQAGAEERRQGAGLEGERGMEVDARQLRFPQAQRQVSGKRLEDRVAGLRQLRRQGPVRGAGQPGAGQSQGLRDGGLAEGAEIGPVDEGEELQLVASRALGRRLLRQQADRRGRRRVRRWRRVGPAGPGRLDRLGDGDRGRLVETARRVVRESQVVVSQAGSRSREGGECLAAQQIPRQERAGALDAHPGEVGTLGGAESVGDPERVVIERVRRADEKIVPPHRETPRTGPRTESSG